MKNAAIPAGWALAKLPQLIGASGCFLDGDWVESKDQEPHGTIRLTQLADVGDGVWRDRSSRFMTPEKAQKLRCTFLETGDVLVARMPDPLGRSCLFPGELKKCVTVVDVCILRPAHCGVSTRWLSHFINAPQFRSSVYQLQSGSTRKRISRKNLGALNLLVPPTNEQHRLVDAIESYFSRLDDAVASLERVKRNLKRYRASVLKAAVEGRLVPTEAELARAEGRDYEPASVLLERILAERRRRWEEGELAKMKAKGDVPRNDERKAKHEEPVELRASEGSSLPEGWASVRADAVCKAVVSGSTPVAAKLSSRNGAIPFIKVYNLTTTGILDFSIKPTFIECDTHEGQLRRSRVFPGDVLTNIVGPPLGQVSVVPGIYPEWNINQAIAAFRPSAAVSSGWLRINLMSEPAQRWLMQTAKTTTSQVNLAITNCRRMPIPLPPIREQERIVGEVDRLLSNAVEIDATVARQLANLRRLRQSVLKWAFEGRLVDQDPTDEPASKLLERIKSERAAEPAQSPARRSRRAKSQRTSS